MATDKQPTRRISLLDDGTLDTVVQLECYQCGETLIARFAEADRHSNGEITDKGWDQLCEDIAEDHSCDCEANQ